jgi:hypothetical protein
MLRWIPILLVILVAGEACSRPPLEETPRPEVSGQAAVAPTTPTPADTSKLEERNAELLTTHAEIWELMSLSEGAREELDGTVVSINAALRKNENDPTELLKQAKAPSRPDRPLTYDAFVQSHKRRFSLLKLSESTRTELLAALDFTWQALHDPNTPEDTRQAAEKIRNLMKSMGGPPPCCDDSMFERAGMEPYQP